MPRKVTPQMLEWAVQRYRALFRSLRTSVGDEQVTRMFERLVKRYQEPHRVYHTLESVVRSLLTFDQVAHHAREPDLIVAAIFYMYVIYDPRRRDNGRKSAQYYRMVARDLLGLPEEDLIKRVSYLIASLDREDQDPDVDPDAALFFDIHASILAADPEEYDEYALRAIRREYPHYNDDEWAIVRIEFFLDPILARKTIFRTKPFMPYDERARANLVQERVALQSQIRQ